MNLDINQDEHSYDFILANVQKSFCFLKRTFFFLNDLNLIKVNSCCSGPKIEYS